MLTWSDYKHHKTGKLLVLVFLNSKITLSKLSTMKTTNKAIILESRFLDLLPWRSNVMRSKDLDFFNE